MNESEEATSWSPTLNLLRSTVRSTIRTTTTTLQAITEALTTTTLPPTTTTSTTATPLPTTTPTRTTTTTTLPPTTTTTLPTTTTTFPTTTTTLPTTTTTKKIIKLIKQVVLEPLDLIESRKSTQLSGAPLDEAATTKASVQGCDLPLAFECDSRNCCEQYQWQVYVLLVALGFILLALVVGCICMCCRKMKKSNKSLAAPIEQQELMTTDRTIEETQYLRRQSAIGPTASMVR